LKLLKVNIGGVTNAIFYVNNSNAYVLVIGWNVDYPNNQTATISVEDENNIVYEKVLFIKTLENSDSVSESGSFSTTAATTEGITSTSESISGSISRYSQVFIVNQKALVPPYFNLYAYNITVYAFLAIQADSLEELRGFL